LPEAKTVPVVRAVPPLGTEYQLKVAPADPVAVKLATVAPEQNVCADAVGVAGFDIVTATVVLVLSQVPTVCET
jgi:hypothetical protein